MKVEQQPHIGAADDAVYPYCLVELTRGRLDQCRNVFDDRGAPDDLRRAREVSAGSLDRCLAARRRREMANLDTAASDKGEVLGPRLGAHSFDDARHPIEPPGCNRHRRGEPERRAMQYHSDLGRQCPQCTQIAACGVEIIVGDDLDQVDPVKMREDFAAAARWLKSLPDSTGKLGAIGFCFGGGVVNQLAVRLGSDLDAAVPFYGLQPDPADVARIKAPINAQYGELDARITSGWPAFDAALTGAHVPHEGHIYKGANHGFHNDTTPRYDEAAAKEAWQRTLDWLNKYLRA